MLFFSRQIDTLSLSYGGQTVPFTNLGIAWTTDKAVKFQNPPLTGKYRKIVFC